MNSLFPERKEKPKEHEGTKGKWIKPAYAGLATDVGKSTQLREPGNRRKGGGGGGVAGVTFLGPLRHLLSLRGERGKMQKSGEE